MNAPASIFCTRLGGTGGIVEPRGVVELGGGGTGGIDEPRGSVVVALPPAGRDRPIMPP